MYETEPYEDGWAIVNEDGRIIISKILDIEDAMDICNQLNEGTEVA